MTEFTVEGDGVTLRGDDNGVGPAILLLHGLSATRRYVVHGSTGLERSGYRVIAYDSRGHGESSPAVHTDGYTYRVLVEDAVRVMNDRGVSRATLVGMSMGAAVAAAVALAHPDRVRALVAITPAHLGAPSAAPERWDALATGLEADGPDGFVAAYGDPGVPAGSREAIQTVMRQRLTRHEHPDAVATALRCTTADAAFDGERALRAVICPTLIVGSRDRLDPEHPMDIAQRWATIIPGARFVVEDATHSPLAWRGSTLSRVIADFVADIPA
ncbi:MAG: alpha/beta hydrolase [Thermoleophilia bacterium]|nr:alpha/beta hydrolase [Thermoleophilia bacterium]